MTTPTTYRLLPSPRSRRRGLIVGAIGTVLALVSACGSSDDGDDSLDLVRSGTLTLCGINNYPPMEFVDSGELVGFDLDLSKAVAEELDLKHDYQVMAFEGIMPALQGGRCDVGWSAMYLNDERQEVADAVPYLATTAQALVAAGNPLGIETLADLSGKRAAIDSGTSNLAIAKDLNKQLENQGLEPMEIQEYPKTPDTFQQIRVGRADVVIDADLVLGYLAKLEPENFEYVRIQDVADGAFAVYVNKGSPLHGEISDAFVKFKNDGSLEEMTEKWGLDPKNLDVIETE